MLRDVAPRMTRVAVLYEPDMPGMDLYSQATERAAVAMDIQLIKLPGRTVAELDAAFAAVVRERADALYIVPSGAIFTHRARVIEFASRQHLPAIYSNKLSVTEGGSLYHALDPVALMQRTASIIDRILKGARPVDIPGEQPMRFEFIVNLKTARAMKLKIPQSVLLRATEVIE